MLNLDEVKTDGMLSRPVAEHKEYMLIKTLKFLDEVTKTLQRPDVNICNAHANFGTALEYYLCLLDRLDSYAQIVQNPHCESGLPNIQDFHKELLTISEKKSYPVFF